MTRQFAMMLAVCLRLNRSMARKSQRGHARAGQCLEWQRVKRFFLPIAFIGLPAVAQAFQPLERVDGWLIERKLSDQQEPICRASLVGGGGWFSARVHLDRNDELVVPDGLNAPVNDSLDQVREALRVCRASILRFDVPAGR